MRYVRDHLRVRRTYGSITDRDGFHSSFAFGTGVAIVAQILITQSGKTESPAG